MPRIPTLAAALACASLAACGAGPQVDPRSGAGVAPSSAAPAPAESPSATPAAPASAAGAERALVNDDWEILRMATAHGVMTIELELGDLGASGAVARTLVEPLTAAYAEVLVYVYARGRGAGGHAPARRIQWTARDGYVETTYD